jgi:hypothetical protein
LPGFLVSVGVLAATRNFAMALAFGSTRRHFWLGTTAGFVVTAAVTAAAAVLMLGLERLTGHWFVGAYAFDVAVLGNGNIAQTFSVTFVLALLSLTVGALFGTVLRAFGTKATAVLEHRCPAHPLCGRRARGVEVERCVAAVGKLGSVGHGHHRCGIPRARQHRLVCRVSPRDRVTE